MPAGRQVGFVGLGNMGGRMTRRLVAAGVRVVGYDVQAGQAESVGAVPAEALGDVCDGTEVVLLSLPDSKAVESVVLGARPESDGLLDFARPGQVIIDLSTSSPSSTQRIHAALAERGVEYLDAGISGGAAAAEKGTLTIMVGGSAAALESVRWVFRPIASMAQSGLRLPASDIKFPLWIWPHLDRDFPEPATGLIGSEPEKPNDIKSLIDLKNLKVV